MQPGAIPARVGGKEAHGQTALAGTRPNAGSDLVADRPQGTGKARDEAASLMNVGAHTVGRQDMTPSEKVALGKALEALERPIREANKKATQLAGRSPDGKPVFGEEKITAPKGQTRDIVGKAVGMSGPIYQRAKTVVDNCQH